MSGQTWPFSLLLNKKEDAETKIGGIIVNELLGNLAFPVRSRFGDARVIFGGFDENTGFEYPLPMVHRSPNC